MFATGELGETDKADACKAVTSAGQANNQSKIRRAVLRLFGEDPRGKDFTKKLHHQQGLLQIDEDFCLEDDAACANCPSPERLKEWG